MAGVEIKGIDELINALDSLPDKFEKQVLMSALQKLAEEYAMRISATAPYDPTDRPGYYTGHNANGKRSAPGEGTFMPLPHLRASVISDKMNSRSGFIRKKVLANYYSKYLELGTKFIEAEPFIEPIVEEDSGGLLQEFCNDLLGQLLLMAGLGELAGA